MPEPAAGSTLSMAWLTDDLVAETRRVWSKVYGRVVSPAEAVEILMNVKHLAEVLLRPERERSEP